MKVIVKCVNKKGGAWGVPGRSGGGKICQVPPEFLWAGGCRKTARSFPHAPHPPQDRDLKPLNHAVGSREGVLTKDTEATPCSPRHYRIEGIGEEIPNNDQSAQQVLMGQRLYDLRVLL